MSQATNPTEIEHSTIPMSAVETDIASIATDPRAEPIFAAAVAGETPLHELLAELHDVLADIVADRETFDGQETRDILNRGAGFTRGRLEAIYADLEESETRIGRLELAIEELREERDTLSDVYFPLASRAGVEFHHD